MGVKRFFEIPDKPEVMATLVEAVPSSWQWVSGGLFPAEALLASGRVQEDTGFSLQRFHDIHPIIIGIYDKKERRRGTPNLYALMVEQKMPGFVLFDEAGLDHVSLPFKTVQNIAAGFIRKGYQGNLSFRYSDFDNCVTDNPARCDMILQPWCGSWLSYEEEGPQPARVCLEWEERYGGTANHIAPIAVVCERLKLREYTPAATQNTTAS